MASYKILFVSTNTEKAKHIGEIVEEMHQERLNDYDFSFADSELLTSDIMKTQLPDIVILDSAAQDIDLIAINRLIKTYDNVITILLLEKDKSALPELLKNANSFIQEPFLKEILISTIEANLKTKKSLVKLADSNQELARSLYQLNVLYSTSSKFAGTLDREKLMDALIEGIDKSLSFGLSCLLTFKSETEPVLIINSLYKIPDRLLEGLKVRATISYKNLFKNREMPFELDIQNIKVEKHIKNERKEYDFSILRADTLFAPISTSENCVGFIEIFREEKFSTEDTTCFHTLAQQVSLPLKSANLYEIKERTNKKLEKLERTKSEFISIVSHELRTPLTAIKLSMDILSSGTAGPLTEAMETSLNRGKRNVTRLTGIINDLLDLSKIEAGKMDFKFENTKISPIVEYVKNNLEGMAKEKNIEFITTLDDNFADIYADSSRVEQILTNLVSNAIKFTTENGKIEIRSQVVDAKEINLVEKFSETLACLHGKYLQVMVKDNGIGISEENLTHVFDKFAQIENSLTRKVGGSGLGLPIAKQLIESHNGTIWCNSKLEKGSSFYFVIPLLDSYSKFLIDLKQNLQKAKVGNSTLALVKIKTSEEILDEIKTQILTEKHLENSALEIQDDFCTLSLAIPEGDKYSADFLKKRIQDFANSNKNLCENYDIMFSYGVYPRDALDDIDLIKKVNKSFQTIKITNEIS